MNKKILNLIALIICFSILNIFLFRSHDNNASAQSSSSSTSKPQPSVSPTSSAPNPLSGLQKDAESKAKSLEGTARDVSKKASECGITLTVFKLPGTDAVLEDFTDIFRNQCQIDDISKVQNQAEKVKKTINNALIKCDAATVNSLQKDYALLEFELHYARNFVDTTYGNFIVKDNSALLKEAEDYLTKYTNLNLVEITQLANNLQAKYQPRIKVYKNCGPFNGWEKVSERFQRLVKSIEQASGSFAQTATDVGSGLTSSDSKNKETQKQQAKKDAIKRSTKDAAIKYLGEHIDINAPGSAEKVLGKSDIERMKTILPGAKDSGSESISKVTDDLAKSRYNFEIDKEVSALKSRYDILYGEAGDNSINDLLNKLDRLNKTIEDTNKSVLPVTLQCLAIPNEKQCSKIK